MTEPNATLVDAHNLVGEVVGGRYAVQRLLGEGSMGLVFLAEHVHMKTSVAIKVLKPKFLNNPEAVARFEREAQAAGHIDHPNVCRASDFGRLDDDRFFLVMEYIDGETLGALLDRKQRLSPTETVHIARQIASALQRAHDLDVVHRDLKPDNILLIERDGDALFVKVTDFGVARVEVVEAQNLTRAGTTMGTPVYMSPEQATATRADGRSDLYTLGVMMFEMLTGEVPFYHDSLAVILSDHAAKPAPAMREVAPDVELPPDLVAIVERLLHKDADARFQSARELVDALDAAELTVRAPAPVEAAVPANEPRKSPPQWQYVLAGLLGVTAIPALALIIFGAIVMSLVAPTGEEETLEPLVFTEAEVAPNLDAERARFLVDADLHEAVGRMAPADVAARLATVEVAEGQRGHVEFLRARALVDSGAPRDAMAHYEAALDADPRYATEPRLLTDVGTLFAQKDEVIAAPAITLMTRLLAEPDATGAIDTVLEVAVDGHWNARKRSRELLKSQQQWEKLAPWQRDAIDLGLITRSQCERGAKLVKSLADAGNPEALPALRNATRRTTKGCGFLKRADCYRCMRVPMQDAIKKLEAARKDEGKSNPSAP